MFTSAAICLSVKDVFELARFPVLCGASHVRRFIGGAEKYNNTFRQTYEMITLNIMKVKLPLSNLRMVRPDGNVMTLLS